MILRSTYRCIAILLSIGLFALGLAGCESLEKLNPFAEKEKLLPGQRTPVFPEGVPGVDYGAPPPQPASPGGGLPPEPAPTESPSAAPATGQ